MSVKFSLFSFWVGFLTCFIILLQPCWALDVNAVRFGNHADKERAVIELSGPSKFRSFVLTKPDRVIVDLPEFAWKVKNIQPTPGSAIKDVRYGVLGGGQGRLVFETSRPVMIKSAFAMGKGSGQPDRIVIDFSATSAATMAATTGQVLGTLDGKQGAGASGSTKTAKPAATQSIEDAKSKKKKLIIIDPGHGGQDPGARGANGMYEKSIVLAVGLELRRQLEDAGYRVAMTRSTDVFIPLRERVKFARKKEGDLFVSLHADSITRNDVTGASVYTLSDKASDVETEKLAERENKSDLIAGIDLSHQEDDVAGILIDLAARDTMNQSRYLAQSVLRNFDRNDVNTLDGQYRSAGFAVLKAMDIPSVLVEMGYLTNRTEVERLCDPSYQKRIASALKGSIDTYFQKNK